MSDEVATERRVPALARKSSVWAMADEEVNRLDEELRECRRQIEHHRAILNVYLEGEPRLVTKLGEALRERELLERYHEEREQREL